MTGPQVLFALALGLVTVVITVVGGYVASSVFWSDRWRRRGR